MPLSQVLTGATDSAFGYDVAVSGDGFTLAVGATVAGEVHIFTLSGGVWSLEDTLSGGSGFGACVRLSTDGNTLAVSTVVGYPSSPGQGLVSVFVRSAGVWSSQHDFSPEDGNSTYWAIDIDLSGDGNTLIVGDPLSFGHDGGAWVYFRTGTTWAVQSGRLFPQTDLNAEFITALGTYVHPQFGYGVALSGDGDWAIIGGPVFVTVAGYNAGPHSHASEAGGAFWMYHRVSGAWSKFSGPITDGTPKGDANHSNGMFGRNVHISADGLTAIVNQGDFKERSHLPGGDGVIEPTVWVYTRTTGGTFALTGNIDTGTKSEEYTSWGALSSDGTRVLTGKWGYKSPIPERVPVPAVIYGGDIYSSWGGPVPTPAVRSGVGHSGCISDDGHAYIIGASGDGVAYVYWAGLDDSLTGASRLDLTVGTTTEGHASTLLGASSLDLAVDMMTEGRAFPIVDGVSLDGIRIPMH